MNIKERLSKFTSLLLCAALFSQAQVPLFAQSDNNKYRVPAQDLNILEHHLEQVYTSSGNPYQQALNQEVRQTISGLKNDDNAKQIEQARKQNTARGIMLPAYINIAKTKQLQALHKDLQEFIAYYFAEREIMPFDKFKGEYEEYIVQTANTLYREGKTKGYEIFDDPAAQLAQDLKNNYPPEEEYENYKKEAQKEIAWRKANTGKVEEGGYKVIRAYIQAIGPMNLNAQLTAFLLNAELNGKKLITKEERKQIFDYNVSHIERQNLSSTKENINQTVISIILERIIIGGYVSNEDNARYAKALQNLLYRSENAIGFPYILNAVFAGLVSTNNFSVADAIMAKYNAKENKSGPWYQWIQATAYSDLYRDKHGHYLGNISRQAQYTTQHAFKNAFEDIALMLSKDGSPQALQLLRKYSQDTTVNNSIKPFMAGAIISAEGFSDKDKRLNYAVQLANLSLADITATQEYDLDRTLLRLMPDIKTALTDWAIITPERFSQNKNAKHNFNIIERGALATDIALAIWGTIGLSKITIKAIGLSEATYTAIKAGKTTSKLTYIRTNYAKMDTYIKTKRSMLRLKNRISAKFGSTVDIRTMRKLQRDLDIKNIATLEAKAQKSRQAVVQTSSPSARQVARAELDLAKANAYKGQVDYNLKYRLYGESYNTKVPYLDKVRSYNTAQPVLQFTAGELALNESYNSFNNSLSALNNAQKAYKDLNFFNKNFINPIKNWWNKSYLPAINDLPISAMETGKGTTIAKTFGLNTTYTPPAPSDLKFFTPSSNTNWAYKTYDWFNKHNMPWLATGLKFINNKATILGTGLLLNYNIATVAPSSLAAMERIVPATELVMTAPKNITSALTPMKTVSSIKTAPINLNPVSVIDPKIFKTYKTIPLPGGNILNGNLLNFTFVKASDAASAVYGTLRNALEQSKPFALITGHSGGFINQGINFYNPKLARNLVLPMIFSAGRASAARETDITIKERQIPAIEETTPRNYLADFTNEVNTTVSDYFTNLSIQSNALENIRNIENTNLTNDGIKEITNTAYYMRQYQLLDVARYITIPSFTYLSNLLNGDYAMGKNKLTEIIALASKQARSKKDNAKLEENIQNYTNALNLFDAYIQIIKGSALAQPQKPFFAIINPVAPNKFQLGQAPSVQAMDVKEFALAIAANFFNSTNIRKVFTNFIHNASEEKVFSLLPALMKANMDLNNFTDNHPGYNSKEIKGCFIGTAGAQWEDLTVNLTPDRIGISAETQFKDISLVIAQWMHKKNIPFAYKGMIQPQEVFDNLIPWAEDMIGIKPGEGHTYLDDGEIHVYNKDYTKRIRYGKHESKPGKPHIHIETIVNDAWTGIDNKAYYFESLVPAYSDLIIQSLDNLKNYFLAQPYVNIIMPNDGGSTKKVLYILGGPNASGKSSLYNQFFANSGLPFVNQDIIAEQRNIPLRDAGYETLKMIEEMFQQEKSFIYESTLSGRNVISMINTAHEKGYRVIIVYTFVKDPQTSIKLAQQRVQEGGHSVPFEQLTDRYYKSRNNFWDIYKDMADDWIMYLNQDHTMIPLAAKTQNINQMQILENDIFTSTLLKPQDLSVPKTPVISSK